MGSEEYLLVEWVGEDKYSVVSRKSLVDEAFRIVNGEELVGLTLSFLWGRARTEYKGKVIQYGSKMDMQHEVEIYARSFGKESQQPLQCRVEPSEISWTQNASRQINVENSGFRDVRKLTSIQKVLSNVEESTEIPLGEWNAPNNTTCEAEKDLLEQQLTEALKKAAKYKNLAKKRGRRIVELEAMQSNVQMQQFVDIGNGVKIVKSELNAVKTLSDSPKVFARNLMRLLFKDDELFCATLFGKQCNANKSSPTLTELDPVRRDAIILYTLKSFGNVVENVSQRKNPLLKDVKRSMSDFLREKKRKLQN